MNLNELANEESIFRVSSILLGIGSLLKNQSQDAAYTDGELYGVGEILVEQAKIIEKMAES